MFSHSKGNIDSNVIEIMDILCSSRVNDQSALDLHFIQNISLTIPIFTCHCTILIGINAIKNTYQRINDTSANQNLSIMHTNKI